MITLYIKLKIRRKKNVCRLKNAQHWFMLRGHLDCFLFLKKKKSKWKCMSDIKRWSMEFRLQLRMLQQQHQLFKFVYLISFLKTFRIGIFASFLFVLFDVNLPPFILFHIHPLWFDKYKSNLTGPFMIAFFFSVIQFLPNDFIWIIDLSKRIEKEKKETSSCVLTHMWLFVCAVHTQHKFNANHFSLNKQWW